MVLEQIALLGIAGIDAYLVSSYLNAKKQAGERTKALSYQRTRQPVAAQGSVQASAVSSGDSVILSDRLAAIKSAVGETKFADEVLPYEIGALPASSLADAARLEETSEESVSESSTIVETSTQESTVTSVSPAETSSGALSESVASHERKIQDLNAEFAVLEYRIAEVERALGVERPQESKQIEIPFKPVVVQPVVVARKAVHARKKRKKAGRKKAKAKKIAKKKARPAARKITKTAKTAHKRIRSTHAHKRRKARRQTQRVEVVIKNQAARKSRPKPARKPARKGKAGKSRVEVVVRGAKGTTVKKAGTSGSNRVEVTVAGKRTPPKKAKKKKNVAKRHKRAKSTNRVEVIVKNEAKPVAKKAAKVKHKPKKARTSKASTASNKVEVVVKTASGRKVAVKKKHATRKAANRVEVVLKEPSQKIEVVPVEKEQKPAEKKGASNSKDHMDIEWKGSTIKLYSGETKD